MSEMLLRHYIQALRKSHGWSAQDLATKSHLSVSMVCAIESGYRTGSLLSLKAIAEAFGTSLPALLRDTEWD